MTDRRMVAGALVALLLAGCSATEAPGVPAAEPAPQAPPLVEGPGQTPAPGHTIAAEPAPPTSAREAAAQIELTERAIADPETSPERLAVAAHAQQLAYRELGTRPGWDERVAELIPRDLRRVVSDNVAARRAFGSMHPSDPADLATELPAWRIVAPLPAAQLRGYYREAERRYGIDWEYLAAINLVETGFGRIQGDSVAGARGPMQFIPTTWDLYGEGGDVTDARDAILAAGRLLRANDFATDRDGALYSYNNSSAYVRGVTRYAQVMQRRPRAYLGYHQWPIYYLTRFGSILLPEGYDRSEPISVRRYLRTR